MSPYIDREAREHINTGGSCETAGDLTFALTVVIETYRAENPNRFQTFAEILGALRAAELEFYRRVVAPYEDKKLAENGDVYR